MAVQEQPETEKKSLAARMLFPSVLLLLAIFGFQYFLLVKNKALDEKSEQLSKPPSELAPEEEEIGVPVVKGGNTPKETVLMLISELKTTKDPTVAFQYIWWPSAFDRLPATAKQSLHIRSAAMLYRYYLDVFTIPSATFLHRMSNDLEKIAPSNRAKFSQFLDKQLSQRAKAPPFEKFSNTFVEIKSERIDDGEAEVKLSLSKQKETTQSTIKLIKVQEKWLLPCVQLINDPLGICKF